MRQIRLVYNNKYLFCASTILDTYKYYLIKSTLQGEYYYYPIFMDK